MTTIQSKMLTAALTFLLLIPSVSAQAFKVRDIRVEGAGRVRAETVLSYVSVKKGQEFDANQSRAIINKLYGTGFFTNVKLVRRGNTLVIYVEERPVIGALRISGNKMLKTEDITKVLKENNIFEGAVYNPSTFSGLKVGLEQQYFNLGRYNAVVNTTVEKKGRGRVGIYIDIYEGQTAKIKKITLVGNHAFSEKTLLKHMQLSTTHIWSPLFHSDQYSREKLNADIEAIRSYYMDRGYINFSIEAVQVSITPDKRHVYITLNLMEGPIYKLRDFHVQGDIKECDRKKLAERIQLDRGKPFSRGDIITANKVINAYFQNRGYAYDRVDVMPQVDEAKRLIDVDFVVHPGQRVTVRRITFEGNTRTQDEVLRRELRQFEGAQYSEGLLNLSKRKIDNLGFVEKVQTNKIPVPGHPDQVDITYKMSEASTASARAQVGYSDAVGFIFGAGLNQKNFLGTGRSVGLNVERNSAYSNLNLSYYNPYATISGIGHGYNVFYNKTTPGKVGTSDYSTDSYGVSMSLTFPISEFNVLSLSAGYTRLDFKINPDKASKEVILFTQTNGEDCDPKGYPASFFTPPYRTETPFDQFTLSFGWHDTNFNRAIYPTEGYRQGLVLSTGLPITHQSLSYYKLSYDASYYHPIYHNIIFHTRAKLAYGDGYGRVGCLPFFLNYHAGGMDTVRGLDDNSLGPLDSRNKPLGGNFLTVGSVEMIFPNPLGEKVRSRLFLDAGNVFDNRFALSQVRLTGGVQMDWISPFGPLRFSLGYPINQFSGQHKKLFQFSIGTSV